MWHGKAVPDTQCLLRRGAASQRLSVLSEGSWADEASGWWSDVQACSDERVTSTQRVHDLHSSQKKGKSWWLAVVEAGATASDESTGSAWTLAAGSKYTCKAQATGKSSPQSLHPPSAFARASPLGSSSELAVSS